MREACQDQTTTLQHVYRPTKKLKEELSSRHSCMSTHPRTMHAEWYIRVSANSSLGLVLSSLLSPSFTLVESAHSIAYLSAWHVYRNPGLFSMAKAKAKLRGPGAVLGAHRALEQSWTQGQHLVDHLQLTMSHSKHTSDTNDLATNVSHASTRALLIVIHA